MNAAIEAWVAEREHDACETDRGTQRPTEKFRMAFSGKFRQMKRPTTKSINGIHRRRQKKVLL